MKKALLFMAMVLVVGVQPSFAEKFELFEKLDANKDGKISSQEFSQIKAERAKRAERAFKRFDSNKDGYLDQNEWKVAKAKLEELAKKRGK